MNKLGVHALVWVGGRGAADSQRAIATTGEARLRPDRDPAVGPAKVDPARTARELEEHGLGVVTSLGLAPDTDISTADPEIAARGEALLGDALAVTRDLGARYLRRRHLFRPAQVFGAADRGRPAELRRRPSAADREGEGVGHHPGSGDGQPLRDNLLNTGDQALALIDETGADNITVHLGHLSHEHRGGEIWPAPSSAAAPAWATSISARATPATSAPAPSTSAACSAPLRRSAMAVRSRSNPSPPRSSSRSCRRRWRCGATCGATARIWRATPRPSWRRRSRRRGTPCRAVAENTSALRNQEASQRMPPLEAWKTREITIRGYPLAAAFDRHRCKI